MKMYKHDCGAALAALMLLTMAVPASHAENPFTDAKRAVAKNPDRFGDLPLGTVIRTDERYNQPGLFKGPRGWDYWNLLENPHPYQNPNLWPDNRSTYFLGQLVMPAGSSLTIRGRFPAARYFKFAVYKQERNTFVAIDGEDMAGWDIVPDAESVNPYVVGADRQNQNRNYTIQILAEDAPKDHAARSKNTIYVGRDEQQILAGFRVYVSDKGYDGAGLALGDVPSTAGPAFSYEGRLADGTPLSAADVDQRFARPMGETQQPMNPEQWYALVNAKDNDPSLNPATAPARKDSQWEKWFSIKYTMEGIFKTPEARAQMNIHAGMEGGGDPSTVYMVNYLSRKFGPVYVLQAKMPTFPNTYDGAKTMPDGQVKYWSVGSVGAAPSGQLWDGLSDMAVPLDEHGYYTIVVSRPEDRPKNATPENGVAWMNWGPGEGLDGDPRNRKDWGMLMMRFMTCHPDWANCPGKVLQPGMEEAVMGPYYPKGYYTSKADFEAKGPRKVAVVSPADPTRNRQVKPYTVTDTRDMRFCEILVVKKTGVEIFNTTGLNDCPAERWDTLDLEKIKQQFGALQIQKNGPHFWMMDSQTVSFGETASFDGIEARWGADVDPELLKKSAKGAQPYTVFNPKKTQKMVYAKGKPVFELVDAEGHVYVMQAHDENFTLESLATLGDHMKALPKGWQYRTRILSEDLVLDLGPGNTIYGVGDEFRQYYTRIQENR